MRRALGVVAVAGLLTGLAAVAVEYRFWWLTLTGLRATARVTARQEHVVGWAFTRRGAAAGKAYPITETEFRYAFLNTVGVERQSSFRIPGSSRAFRAGDAVGIMYPRFGNGPGQPSAWSFYAEHDPAWLTFTSVGVGGLAAAAACGWWRSRVGRSGPPAAPLRAGGRAESS